jgi:hypothetical protein
MPSATKFIPRAIAPKFVSLVHHNHQVGLGSLNAKVVRTIRDDMQILIDSCKLDIFVGHWDLSANWSHLERATSKFFMQIAGIGYSHDWPAVVARARKLFPITESVPKPVYFRNYDGASEAVAYTAKRTFYGRETYLDPYLGRPDRAWSMNTRSRPLRVPERIEVLTMLNDIGFAERSILSGARFALKDGKPRILFDMFDRVSQARSETS